MRGFSHGLAVVLIGLLHSTVVEAQPSVESATSDGERVTLTVVVPGGDPTGLGLFRMETNQGFWTRLRAAFERDENGQLVRVGLEPTTDPERFVRRDPHVELGREYCYAAALGGTIRVADRRCVIHQPLGAGLRFPSAPRDLRIPRTNVHNLTLEFEDTADNELEFLIERRFSRAPWQTVALLPEEPGIGARVRHRERDLEMSTRYCYRVTATNDDGSRGSGVLCRKTAPAVVPSVSPPDSGAGFLSNLGHPSDGALAVTFVFTRADFDRAFTVALHRLDALDADPERTTVVRVRSALGRTSASTIFEDLDPDQTYCARIKTAEVGDRFDTRVLCESPFGRRTEVDHRGPSQDELPGVLELVPLTGALRVDLENPRRGQLLDMVEANTGLRQTRLEGVSGDGTVTLRSLRRGAIYCVRTAITNDFGSRYGRFVCARVRAGGSSGGGGGLGGSSGGSGDSEVLSAGVDCGCGNTGSFVDATEPSPSETSPDGLYRASTTPSSVSVVRVSDNERLFNETALSADFAFGFGPRGRYFVLAEPEGLDRVVLSVHDLEAGGNKRRFLDSNVRGSAGWGFSPDGRTFMAARIISTGQLGVSLVNLETGEDRLLTFQRPFSGFFQFSPCGDVFATGLGPSPTAQPFISLFSTAELETLATAVSLPGDFTGVAATEEEHIVNRQGGGTQSLVPNTGGQACLIPGSATDGYELDTVRYPGVLLNNGDADLVYSAASTVLQVDDGPGDVACDVTFERSGPVVASSLGDGSVDSEAELDAIFAEPGHAKAVDQLNFCGGLQPGLLGCAPTPGDTFVFVRGPEEDTTVAHEFGHNKGLEHRDLADDPDALMYPSGSPTAKKVNAAECDAFRSSGVEAFRLAPPPAVIQPRPGSIAADDHESAPIMPIDDFVRRRYYEGIPFEAVQRYDDSVLPVLLGMLDDPEESAAWPNIVVTLGMLGNSAVVPALVDFIEADASSMTRSLYRAKTSALMALGYIVNLTGDDEALTYLQNGVSPSAWRTRASAWMAPFQSTLAERDADLSKSAILGLALAATPKSRQILISLRDGAPEIASETDASLLIDAAIAESRAVAALGLRGYYQRRD